MSGPLTLQCYYFITPSPKHRVNSQNTAKVREATAPKAPKVLVRDSLCGLFFWAITRALRRLCMLLNRSYATEGPVPAGSLMPASVGHQMPADRAHMRSQLSVDKTPDKPWSLFTNTGVKRSADLKPFSRCTTSRGALPNGTNTTDNFNSLGLVTNRALLLSCLLQGPVLQWCKKLWQTNNNHKWVKKHIHTERGHPLRTLLLHTIILSHLTT